VVHVVQPATGAVVLYRRFSTGAIPDLDGGTGVAMILGNTSDKISAIVSGVPEAIELLPTNQYRNNGADWLAYAHRGERKYWTGDVFHWYRNALSPPGLPNSSIAGDARDRLIERLGECDKFHKWLGGV
jgi:hypothetical protein